MKKSKRAEKANKSCKAKKALKTGLVVLGFGAEEWSNDDWAEEELDS